MKLSTKRKNGYIHVRGGRFLRVILPHAVSGLGKSSLESDNPDDFSPSMARAGDLAVEIYGIKARKVLGHSYLSGDACRLNGYIAKPAWFDEASGIALPVHTPGVCGSTTEECSKVLIERLYNARYLHDVALFDLKIGKGEGSIMDVVKTLEHYARLVPKDHDDTRAPNGHILGVISMSKKDVSTFALQPVGQTSPNGPTMFQTLLALSSSDIKVPHNVEKAET